MPNPSKIEERQVLTLLELKKIDILVTLYEINRDQVQLLVSERK